MEDVDAYQYRVLTETAMVFAAGPDVRMRSHQARPALSGEDFVDHSG